MTLSLSDKIYGGMGPRPDGPVMVGVDGSDSGRLALHVAADTAEALGAAVVAVYVREWPPRWLWASAMSGWVVALPPPETDELAAFLDATRILEPTGVPWHFLVRTGDPATELERAAREAGAVLLVVGQRPHGRVSGWLHHCPAVRLAHRRGVPVQIAAG